MIKIKKITLDGLALDMTSVSKFGLDVVVLNKLELIEHIDTPLGPARGLLTSSKISKFTNDYNFIDIVPCQEKIESTLCAKTDKGIIYYNREDHKVLRSTCSDNIYSSDSKSWGWKQYGDKLYITEEIDHNWKTVSCFDIYLNLLMCEKMSLRETHFSEEEPATSNRFWEEFNDANPNLNLLFTPLSNIHNKTNFMTHCYDNESKKDYFIKFSNGLRECWRIEIPQDLFISEYFPFISDFYYGAYALNRIGHKWRVLKISKDGIIADSFDFRGADPILSIFNNKLAVVFTDIENFEPWQKELLKEGQYVGPSGIIIIED